MDPARNEAKRESNRPQLLPAQRTRGAHRDAVRVRSIRLVERVGRRQPDYVVRGVSQTDGGEAVQLARTIRSTELLPEDCASCDAVRLCTGRRIVREDSISTDSEQ